MSLLLRAREGGKGRVSGGVGGGLTGPRGSTAGISESSAAVLGEQDGKTLGLAALRDRVRRLEQGTLAGRRRPVAPLGLAALDAALPGGGLPLGALHEIEGARAEWDDGVTLGFCLALLARMERAFPDSGQIPPQNILWISRQGDLYPPALAGQGLDPGRFLLVRAKSDHEVLWALEEGLRCRRLAAVVGELDGLDRLAGRRLQLAAEANGVTAFALHRRFRPRARGRAASAALSRWRVTPMVSGTASSNDRQDMTFIGRPRWRLDLLRCRGAAPGSWHVEWDDATCGFALAPALRDRPLGPGKSPGQPAGPSPARDAEIVALRHAV